MQTNIPTDRQGWGKELGKVEKKLIREKIHRQIKIERRRNRKRKRKRGKARERRRE